VNAGAEAVPVRTALWVAVPWVAAAFLATICGIGGGLFAVPLLHYVGKLPLRTAVGTSLVLVLVLALTATAAEAARADSALEWRVAGLLIVGGVPGAQLGFRFAQKLKTNVLKRVFVVVLLLAGLRILFVPSGGGAGSGASLSGLELALVPLVGLGGGFVAPLLGIGGGLVVVPALFLGFAPLGYLEARACSLAMSVAAAGWSVTRYLRTGEVHLPSAAVLAVSTVIGAVAGVLTVHRAGWSDVARTVMGLVLLFVAARFAVDVWRARARWGRAP
jgi:uncharacterized membrane protein YfcA